jgi:hypothetical protein
MPVQTAVFYFDEQTSSEVPFHPHLARGRRLQHNVRRRQVRRPQPRPAKFGVGARVCLAPGRRHPDFLPAEAGVVTLMLHPSTRGVPLYTVRRECDGREATCYEDELNSCQVGLR